MDEGAEKARLWVEETKLVGHLPGGWLIEFTLSRDGKHLYGRWLDNVGEVAEKAIYERATTGQIARLQTGMNMESLANGIGRWHLRRGHYPKVQDVMVSGDLIRRWPTNPYTGSPIRPGKGAGNFRYTFNEKQGFTLTFFLPNGERISTQGQAP